MRESQEKIAHRLVGHLLQRLGHHLCIDEVGGLFVFAVKDELADFGKIYECIGIVRVIWTTRIERVLVKLDPLAFNAAEDHCSKSSVTYRKGFGPYICRTAIPEAERFGRSNSLACRSTLKGINAW